MAVLGLIHNIFHLYSSLLSLAHAAFSWFYPKVFLLSIHPTSMCITQRGLGGNKDAHRYSRPLHLALGMYDWGNAEEIHELAGRIHAVRAHKPSTPTPDQPGRAGSPAQGTIQPWHRRVRFTCLVASRLQCFSMESGARPLAAQEKRRQC